MLKSLLPPTAVVAEAFGDSYEGGELFPEEEALIARAVSRRRQEFATTRQCARQALAGLGIPGVAIPAGPKREPLWPAGVVGSLTHCDGYRAAAVARDHDLASLGIDAEPHQPLPDRVLATVARPAEISHLEALAASEGSVHWDRLLFSAKESVYKAWFPLAQTWLGFHDAMIEFDQRGGAFTATLLVPGPECGAGTPAHGAGMPGHGAGRLAEMRGRFAATPGLLITAIAIPAGDKKGEQLRRATSGDILRDPAAARGDLTGGNTIGSLCHLVSLPDAHQFLPATTHRPGAVKLSDHTSITRMLSGQLRRWP